jgi:hypothetical protein
VSTATDPSERTPMDIEEALRRLTLANPCGIIVGCHLWYDAWHYTVMSGAAVLGSHSRLPDALAAALKHQFGEE